jgi:hypothetical protein
MIFVASDAAQASGSRFWGSHDRDHRSDRDDDRDDRDHKCSRHDRDHKEHDCKWNRCRRDSDCKRGESCGRDRKCHEKPTPKPECTCDDDCDRDEFCGQDQKCHDRPKCDDQNACTVDKYEGKGECSHTPIEGCTPCSCDADCNDGDACTTDSCKDGVCENADTECPECTTVEQCDDGNACTADACDDGVCTHTPMSVVEVCTDGIDNDCDGMSDCADTDCAAAPSCAPPAEICGDCADNDGDGLIDFEDDACCGRSYHMALSRGRIVPKGATSRLRLKSNLATAGLADVNPMVQDVFLQIRPAGSTDILCARVPASKFMSRRKNKTFKYWGRMNPAPSAQGIGDMKIKIARDGSVRFRTVGKKVKLANPKQGALQITVGFHNAGNDAGSRCSSTMASFQAAKKALIAK